MPLPTPTLSYREAGINDKDQLKQLGIISYGQYQPQMAPEHFEAMNRNLHDDEKVLALINTSKCFVCLHGDKIIGMAYLVLSGNPWDVFEADWSYIRMVGVDPAYQGKGIARKLTGLCIDFAKQNNEKVIALHTSEMMDAARHIYESLGFKKVREIPLRLGKVYWLYQLELKYSSV